MVFWGMVVSEGNLIDAETGETLESVAGMTDEEIGRLLWTKYRHGARGIRNRSSLSENYAYDRNGQGILVDDFRTYEENKAIVGGQLETESARTHARRAERIVVPSDLSKRSRKWWETFINGGYTRNFVLRHKNGKPLTKAYMAKKLGVSVRNVEYILKELTDKGYLMKEGTFYRMKNLQFEKGQVQHGGRKKALTESQERIFERLC